jgi:predicted aspartyl protease
MPSFTTKLSDLQAVGPTISIQLAVGSIAEDAFSKEISTAPAPVSINAMIDTGATGTVIREDLVSSLGLKPVGATLINTPSSTNVLCYKYLTRLLLPHNVIIESVVIAAPLQGQHIQCLIGRDILRQGVFIYIGYDNSFTLSF